jgi:hypothetical protein
MPEISYAISANPGNFIARIDMGTTTPQPHHITPMP